MRSWMRCFEFVRDCLAQLYKEDVVATGERNLML